MHKIRNIPIVKIKSILNIFRGSNKKIDKLFPIQEYNYVCLDKSRRALALIYKAKQASLKRKPIILIPGYICNDLINELELIGAKLKFYINESNSEKIYKEVKDINFDIFLHVNYFGNLTLINKRLLSLIQKKSSWLVEDSTHSTYINHKENEADFILYSPYKIFGTLNGGSVLIKKKFRKEYKYIQKKIDLLKNNCKNYKIKSICSYILWFFKTFIHILNLFTKLPEYRFYNKSYNNNDQLISHRVSWEIIGREAEKLNYIIKKRIENKKTWDNVIKITCPFLESVPNNSIPYFCTYKYKPTKANINKILMYRKFGIPFSNWPDLPEIVFKSRKFKSLIKKKNSLVLLPCHQSLNKKEIILKTMYAFNNINNKRNK